MAHNDLLDYLIVLIFILWFIRWFLKPVFSLRKTSQNSPGATVGEK
jgi:hypothetical protein